MEQPNWALLPDRPEAFFRLGSEYEGRDLKRAYTRLIKHFKPERHPDEFQRIRAAYEVLDERLRYGASTTIRGETAHDHGAVAASESVDRGRVAANVDVVALLGEHGAEGARERLRLAANDDPTAWARLALLDDALDPDPLKPYRTLLEGLIVTGGASAVTKLLAAFLHEDIEPQIAATVLAEFARATSSGAVPAPMFWFLTDHQWTRLVDLVDFDSFAALLNRCIKAVGEDGRAGQLVLMLRLRRRAVLRADDEWLEELDGEVVEGLREMADWAERDYDTADWLSRYRLVRESFVDGTELRGVIDEALVAIVVGDDVNADRAFLLAMSACAERPDDLFDSFGVNDESTAVVTEILDWYGDDLRERQGSDEDEPRGPSRRSIEFSRRLHRRSMRTFVGRVWSFTLVAVLAIACGAFVSISVVFFQWLGYWALPISAAGLFVGIVGFRNGWLGVAVIALSGPFVWSLHRTFWRPLTAEFLAECRVPLNQLVEALEAEEDSLISMCASEAIAKDDALSMYSNAVRSLD